MRARRPHTEGLLARDDVRIHYEVYGSGAQTILFIPTWTFVHSRVYKAQIPYFSERFRCVTYDPRGNGKSDRPQVADAYRLEAFVDDAVAVMDATRTERAVLFGYSISGLHAAVLAAYFPERVQAVVTIGTNSPLVPTYAYKNAEVFEAECAQPEGWQKYNRRYWQTNFADFAEFFARQIFVEPHSTKRTEDTIEWALQTDGETLARTMDARTSSHKYPVDAAMYRRIRCPLLLIHGDRDPIAPLATSERVAQHTGGKAELVIMTDAGHAPHARFPAKVNTAVRDFMARELGTWSPRKTPRRARAGKKALYLSSPIGLGHGRRDIAIARELRERRPDLQIDWLAQDPVTRLLCAGGETIHPASGRLASESTHIESEAGEHDLHAFEAIRRMDEILVANFMTFQEVLEQDHYDLVIADEAWEVDHYWHEHPELKRTQIAWLTDFVGWVPMPAGGEREALLTADYNAEMIEHVENHPRVRDRAIFVGNPADVIPLGFGRDLPQMREWVPRHFDFCGYVIGRHPRAFGDRQALRARLGYREEPVCVVTVGGSGVGGALIRRLLAACPIVRARVPDLRMVVVAGPRVDVSGLRVPRGAELHAFVPDLDQHLAACDLAVVQGGLTTCMELTAAGTPFLYFPLRNHFEQNFHVAHRLDQYRAGRRMDYAAADPDTIAAAMVEALSEPPQYRPVEADGAARAAAMLLELL